MRRFARALLLTGALGSPAAFAETDAFTWTYQYLLVTSTTQLELAPIAERIIYDDELPNLEISDVAAEVLLARIGDPEYPLDNKIRLLRIVKAAKSKRYDAIVRRVQELEPSNAKANWARAARLPMFRDDDAEYVPGSIDIRALVENVEDAALAAKPTTAQGRHLLQFPGGSIEELFQWAGRPHHVVSDQRRVSDGIIHVKFQRIDFYYRGLGRVTYHYRSTQRDWMFKEVVADPLAFEEEFPYRQRAAQLGMPDPLTLEMIQLVSNYPASMRVALQMNFRRSMRPLEFMDTAAEILDRQFKSAKDFDTVDVHAWICRLLATYGGSRYEAILQRVAAETTDSKLRRFARMPIEPNSQLPQAPYVPGTMSLDVQRAKYPSLYPDSTVTGRRD